MAREMQPVHLKAVWALAETERSKQRGGRMVWERWRAEGHSIGRVRGCGAWVYPGLWRLVLLASRGGKLGFGKGTGVRYVKNYRPQTMPLIHVSSVGDGRCLFRLSYMTIRKLECLNLFNPARCPAMETVCSVRLLVTANRCSKIAWRAPQLLATTQDCPACILIELLQLSAPVCLPLGRFQEN